MKFKPYSLFSFFSCQITERAKKIFLTFFQEADMQEQL
jgi:hypothetical protein